MEEQVAFINAQTARIGWPELARHFARGNVVIVAVDNDLVEVATGLVTNDQAAIEKLIEAGLMRRASDADAKQWNDQNSEFWAVVIAPWVLVQERFDV